MLKRGFLGVIVIFILTINLISANSYYLEFNQIQDKVVIKSSIDNNNLISYVDPVTLDKSGANIYFVKKITFNQSFDEVKIKLNLDRGVIIKDNLIFPAGYNIETDGQVISIVWNLGAIKSESFFAMFVTLEDTSKSFNWGYLIALLLVSFIASYFIYKKFKTKVKTTNKSKYKIKKESKIKSEYDYLLDTEKRVIEELKKADRNELWQKQIQNSTGFSKAKVSRLVRNLESRNLILKIPFGNTNKIRLK